MPTPPEAPPRRRGIPHLPALDGLRGLAVIGVLLFHDGRLPGGYLGVDLFFVLSGFLITSLLLAEWSDTGKVDLAAFWVRRARRLFPALLALLPAVAIYAVALAKPVELGRIRSDGIATLLYVANWHTIAAGQSYWALFNAPSPLDHTWSLAIEEQFYVVWPLVTVVFLKRYRGSAKVLFTVAAVLAAASILAMWRLYTPEGTSRAYQGTDTRGAAILLGAALACVVARARALSDRAVRVLDAAGFVAAGVLALAWARLDGKSSLLYHGGFTGTEVAVLVIIACAREGERSLVARALAIRPLVSVGLISYGVYLWHWPIFVALTPARTGLGPGALTLLRLAATLGVSLVSYRFLEQPIRKHGLRWGKPIVVVPAAAALAAASIVVATRGARTPEEEAAAAGVHALPASGVPEGSSKILVLGDSVAVALGERLRFVQGSIPGYAPFVIARGKGDCSLLHDQLPTRSLNHRAHDGGDCDAKWVSDVEELHPDITLIVLGGGFFAPVEVYGKWQRPCEDGWRRAYSLELQRNLEALRENGGRRVLVIVPYPVGGWVDATPHSIVDCYNDTLREAAAASPGVTLLDLQGKLCPEGTCALTSEGAPIRPDGLHFDGKGAEEIARWVLGQLR